MRKIFGSSRIFLTILTILASVFTIIYLVSNGNNYNFINEVVMESTYSTSLNKICGINLIYILSFFGLAAYTAFYAFFKYKNNNDSQKDIPATLFPKIIVIILGIITGISYIFWHYDDYTLAYLFIFSLFLYYTNKEKLIDGIILFLMNLYSLFALYRLFVSFGVNKELYCSVILLIAFILSYVLLKVKISKVILIEQIVLPFLLLVFVVDKYNYLSLIKEQIITIPAHWQIRAFIFSLILLFLFEAVYLIKKYWKEDISLNKIMSYGSCVSIMGYNAYQFFGAFAPLDAHHFAENIIGFHQIFQMGQTPLSEFAPVSGFYSVLHGALLQVFGNGLITQYFPADNIFCLIVALLIVFLLKFHTDKITRFFICVCFLFPTLFPANIHYDRILFILPIMLILSLPKLIENKNLWLCVWILTSLFHGLYYPVFGVAVCIGFLPLAIYQFVSLILSKEFVNQIKTLQFWLSWAVTLSTVGLATPLLLRMYTLIKLMGGHSAVLGISRFGQNFNEFFMTGAPLTIKLILLYIITFVVPALLVWVTYAFTLKTLDFKFNKKLSDTNIKNACLISSLVLIPLFSFSYTLLRLEAIKMFVRAEAVIIAVVVMLVLFAQRYLKTNKYKYYLIGFGLCLISISYSWGFTENSEKLQPYYTAPSIYTYVGSNNSLKMGTGFVKTETLKEFPKICAQFDKNNNYFGAGNYATYYICDIKGVSFIEFLTIRYKAITEHTIKDLLEHNPVIDRDIDSVNNYYLYNWMMTSGEYFWDKKSKMFFPNNGKYTKEQVRKINKTAKLNFEKVYAGYIPATLAPSINILSDEFLQTNFKFTVNNYKNYQRINFEKYIDGNDVDFVYLEFEGPLDNYDCSLHNMLDMLVLKGCRNFHKPFVIHNYNSNKLVQIEYRDDKGVKHVIFCFLQRGKLLIPLGSGSKWLLNKHSYIDVKLLEKQKNRKIKFINSKSDIKIKNVRFLKLKGVNLHDE